MSPWQPIKFRRDVELPSIRRCLGGLCLLGPPFVYLTLYSKLAQISKSNTFST